MIGYQTTTPPALKSVKNISTLNATPQTIAAGGLSVAIQNTGANPMYFTEINDDSSGAVAGATSALVAANTTFPFIFTAKNLSIVGTAGATSCNIIFFDII